MRLNENIAVCKDVNTGRGTQGQVKPEDYLLLRSKVRVVERKTNLIYNLFLVYFVNLYMFRAYLGPPSTGTTVCIQQLVM